MKVITSEEEYATDVTKYTSKWYGAIDFERFDLVMITEGYHSQRNYSIEVQSVYKDVKNNVHVKVVYRTGYGDNCTFSSSLVNQEIVIQIPKNSRVYFDDSVEYYSCDE